MKMDIQTIERKADEIRKYRAKLEDTVHGIDSLIFDLTEDSNGCGVDEIPEKYGLLRPSVNEYSQFLEDVSVLLVRTADALHEIEQTVPGDGESPWK